MRPSTFNSFFDALFPGTYLGYNTFSSVLLTFDEAEMAEVSVLLDELGRGAAPAASPLYPRLVRAGFVVRDDFDERAEVKRRYRDLGATLKGMSLTIAPTVSCNFACSYCFQEHPKRTMGRDEIEAIVRRVEEGLEPGTSLGITWFGGEPLMAMPVLRELAERLAAICRERGAAISQSMVSNGYLLDDEIATFLAAQPGFRYVQITLDGPAAVHDSRRFSASGQPTFDRILDNIEQASKRVRIAIRCNVDRTNVGDLEGLVEALVARGLTSRVSVYLGHVQPYTDVCSDAGETALSKEEFAAADARFRFHLFQRGFLSPAHRPRANTASLCVADHPNGAVLAPGGLEFKCWNETAMGPEHASARYAGAAPEGRRSLPLAQGGGDEAPAMAKNLEGWTGYDPFFHEPCQTCPVMPLCRGGCPWESRKRPAFNTGHCTPYKWNLGDILRIHHMSEVVRHGLSGGEPEAELPCQ